MLCPSVYSPRICCLFVLQMKARKRRLSQTPPPISPLPIKSRFPSKTPLLRMETPAITKPKRRKFKPPRSVGLGPSKSVSPMKLKRNGNLRNSAHSHSNKKGFKIPKFTKLPSRSSTKPLRAKQPAPSSSPSSPPCSKTAEFDKILQGMLCCHSSVWVCIHYPFQLRTAMALNQETQRNDTQKR